MNILERVKRGEIPEDIEIYDAHAHIGKWFSVTARQHDAPSLIDIMDHLKFRRMAISSSLAICGDFKNGNDQVTDAIDRYPGRFFGYITINPNHKDGLIDEVLRLENHKDIIGLKVHPHYNEVNVTDARYHECCSYANQKKMPVLVHTFSYGDISMMRTVIEKYPNAKFILAHCGAWTGMELTAEVIRKYPNAYCDLSMGSAPLRTVEYLVEYGDENKIFFGTDSPLADYRITYGRVLCADIPDETKRKIMGLNFKKCLGME